MSIVIVFNQRLSVIRIQSDTVLNEFTYLRHGQSKCQRTRSSKDEGQGHKILKISFSLSFRGTLSFGPCCLLGLRSKFKDT